MMYKEFIKDVPNFPKPGILFKDITPVFENAEAFKKLIDDLAKLATSEFEFDKLALIESRGFILGSALALKLNKDFCLLRKPGKLPRPSLAETYDLEYGTDTLHVHSDSIKKGERVLILDDLLATGGTAAAAEKLINRSEGELAGVMCFIELAFLNGRSQLKSKFEPLIKY